MRAFFLTILLCFMSVSASASDYEEALKKHRWEDRLVLVFADDSKNAEYVKQMGILNSNQEGLDERDIVVYEFIGSDVVQGFSVRLYGKDGGEKLRAPEAISKDDIFGAVDSMPMRQREMRDY